MYYIIHWYNDTLLVYDAATNLMADTTASTVLGAIRIFNLSSWNVSSQPHRFVFTKDTILEYNSNTGKLQREHPIIYKFPDIELSYLQQHYPELLI